MSVLALSAALVFLSSILINPHAATILPALSRMIESIIRRATTRALPPTLMTAMAAESKSSLELSSTIMIYDIEEGLLPRVMTNSIGTVTARHDYLPFGEEITASVGARTANQGYVADNLRQKFTGKERDVETGLDYFNARYCASAQGRFTSPDSFGDATLNPQTLNLYADVQNNPLKFIAPTASY